MLKRIMRVAAYCVFAAVIAGMCALVVLAAVSFAVTENYLEMMCQ